MSRSLHPNGNPCQASVRPCPLGADEHLTPEEFARKQVEDDLGAFEQHSGWTDEAMDEIAASYEADLARGEDHYEPEEAFLRATEPGYGGQSQAQKDFAAEWREDFAHQKQLDELDRLDIKMVREPGEFPYSEVRSAGGKNLGTVMRRDGVYIAAVHDGRAPKNIGGAYEVEDEAMLALIENDGEGQAQDAAPSSLVVDSDTETSFHKEGWVESGPKFPGASVNLSGEDGNAFGILGKVQRGLRRAGASEDEVSEFHREATSGDYDHLLQTAMRWVEVE